MKNGLNYKRKLLFLIFWLFLLIGAKAQPNLAFYSLDHQFNSGDYNPAFLTSRHKFTFSMFPLAGTSVGYNNQEVIKNLTSRFLSGTITNEEFKKVFERMATQSFFHQNLESSLLSFTYHSNIGFFNFKVKDSEYFLAAVKGDITKFIFKSDQQTAIINQIQYLPAQSSHYREYSLGYSYKAPSNRFSAGIRAKLYFGKYAFFSTLSGAIQKDPNTPNDYILKTSGMIHISFPQQTILAPHDSVHIQFKNSTIFNYLFNSGNPGAGIDLGFNYRIMPELSFSMSVIDLGKINWKTNRSSRNADKAYPLAQNYVLGPPGDHQTITKENNYNFSDLIDFSKLDRDSSAFSRPLPTTLYTGLKYQLNPSIALGITDRFVIVKDLNYNSLTFTSNFTINKNLSISTGYSILADSYFNIPLAFLFQGDVCQFFLGTDNLTAILIPSAAEFAGLSFGACFYLFGKRDQHRKPSDYTPFYKPRKILKNKKTGLLINPQPEY
ncbi:MAG TPA: DUF5723 family protein [Prolixibacteraceae bacterium]|jgi:hypothetical protein